MNDRLLIRISKLEMALRKKLKTKTNERGSWFTVAAVLVTVVSGAYTGVAAAQSAKAQQGAANYSADQARLTAEMQRRTSETNASFAQNKGAQESKDLARRILVLRGAQEAAMGAMGIGGATAAAIKLDTSNKEQMDQLAIRYNSDVASWEARNEGATRAWELESEATQYGAASRNIGKASKMNTTATILNTVSQVVGIGATRVPTSITP